MSARAVAVLVILLVVLGGGALIYQRQQATERRFRRPVAAVAERDGDIAEQPVSPGPLHRGAGGARVTARTC